MMMKRLKRIQNGGSANANSNHGSQKLQIDSASMVEAKLSHVTVGKESASVNNMAGIAALTHPGIISTSSWRVGETLVQKQLKEQQQQQRLSNILSQQHPAAPVASSPHSVVSQRSPAHSSAAWVILYD